MAQQSGESGMTPASETPDVVTLEYHEAIMAQANGRIDDLERRLREVQEERDRLLDSECDKLLAMPADRIEAALRLEGRDPKDAETIGKQAHVIALLRVDLRVAEQKAKRLEKALRELLEWCDVVPSLTEQREAIHAARAALGSEE